MLTQRHRFRDGLHADAEKKIHDELHLDAGRTAAHQKPLLGNGLVDGDALLEGILVSACKQCDRSRLNRRR